MWNTMSSASMSVREDIHQANAYLRELTPHTIKMLATPPPGHGHFARRHPIGTPSVGAGQTMRVSGSANNIAMDKETFEPNIPDRIKQRRRSSTKASGSTSLPQNHASPKPNMQEATMSVDYQQSPQKRGLSIDGSSLPSQKRPRCLSEITPPGYSQPPRNDGLNLAELLLRQSIELNSRHPLSSTPRPFDANVFSSLASITDNDIGPANLPKPYEPTLQNLPEQRPSVGASSCSRDPARQFVTVEQTRRSPLSQVCVDYAPDEECVQIITNDTSVSARFSPMQKPESDSLSTYISQWVPPKASPFKNFTASHKLVANAIVKPETGSLNPLAMDVSQESLSGSVMLDNPLQMSEANLHQRPAGRNEDISSDGPASYPTPARYKSIEHNSISEQTPQPDMVPLSIPKGSGGSRSVLRNDTDPSDVFKVPAPAHHIEQDLPVSQPQRLVKLPIPARALSPVVEIELGRATTPPPAHVAPQCSVEAQRFVDQVKTALKAQSKRKTANVGKRQAKRILQLLEIAKPPDTSEALFLSGEEACKYFEPNKFFPGPVFTENQQTLPLQTVEQFLGEYYDDNAKVWIQDPDIKIARGIPLAREITIGKLKERFLQPSAKAKMPWNCLELATHVEDGLRPAFLNNEDCRLLTKLKHPAADDQASRRSYDPGWKEVEKWALVAQAGALTEPHQDSHGYSTYITLNQGAMGFGWLANPTADERKEWRSNYSTFTGGRWRYAVLRPGQTVFFPSGTVHFVFRLASTGDTLAFGGHVLRCSQIATWVKTMIEERMAPDITNEDITVSAPAYLERVEKFVKPARRTGQAAKWGGDDNVREFLRLKEEFVNLPR